MDIKESVTQYEACLQNGGCEGVDNQPSEGYRQLNQALNADPDTAQNLLWATDLKWQ